MNSNRNIENNRSLINTMLLECDKMIVKLNKRGRHIEAVEFVQKKKKLEEALTMTDKVEEAYDSLLKDKNLNSWFSKTMSLAITMADMAIFYSDLSNSFLKDKGLFQSLETRDKMAELKNGVLSFRKFYSDLMEKDMRIQNYNLFDDLEKSITGTFFTEEEKQFYNKYNE